MVIEAEIKQWGNSYGIRIPKSFAKKHGLEPGDRVSYEIIRKHLAVHDGFGILREDGPKRKINSTVRDKYDDLHEW